MLAVYVVYVWTKRAPTREEVKSGAFYHFIQGVDFLSFLFSGGGGKEAVLLCNWQLLRPGVSGGVNDSQAPAMLALWKRHRNPITVVKQQLSSKHKPNVWGTDGERHALYAGYCSVHPGHLIARNLLVMLSYYILQWYPHKTH